MWKWIYRVLIGFAVLMLLWRGADRLARRTDPLPVVPQPNGYAELIVAAQMTDRPSGDLTELTDAQVRGAAEENRPGIEHARNAMGIESGVPLKTKRGWQEQHNRELKDLKELAIGFALEARAMTLDGRTNEAARCHLDVIRLGQTMCRGGVFVDGVTGLTIETLGVGSLRAMVPVLDAVECRSIARTLEELEERRASAADILATERRWSAASFGLVSRIAGVILRNGLAKRETNFQRRYQEVAGRTRRLMLRSAARAFELETGRPMAAPADLVPGYLKAVPVDPVTGSAVELKPAESNTGDGAVSARP